MYESDIIGFLNLKAQDAIVGFIGFTPDDKSRRFLGDGQRGRGTPLLLPSNDAHFEQLSQGGIAPVEVSARACCQGLRFGLRLQLPGGDGLVSVVA